MSSPPSFNLFSTQQENVDRIDFLMGKMTVYGGFIHFIHVKLFLDFITQSS